MSKSLPDRIEAGVPDIWRGLGAGAGGIWKGIRTLFNFKGLNPQEQISSVPASYNTILANQTFETPEEPCVHPTLGLKGIRVQGSQFLAVVQLPRLGTTPADPDQYLISPDTYRGYTVQIPSTSDGDSALAACLIPITPWGLGQRLSATAVQYQRYRVGNFRIRLVSTCGVNTPGVIAIGYFKDWADATDAFSASTPGLAAVSQLTPSVAIPVNVAQAEMTVSYNGPEAYYVGKNDGVPWPDSRTPSTVLGDAQNRQEIQGGILMVCDRSYGAASPAMNMYLDYDVEFYDPFPVNVVEPATVTEHKAVREVLAYLRQSRVARLQPFIGGAAAEEPRLSKLRVLMDDEPVEKGGSSAAAASPSRKR